MKHFQRILAATDLTKTSAAVHEAIEMAKEYGAELLIAHVYEPPNLGEASVTPGVYEQHDRSLRKEVDEKLKLLVGDAKKEGINAFALVLSGAPHEAIARAATENEADLVVMGTHGRKGVSRLFLGSVAARVIATAPCPVMTVHAA